MAPLLYDKPLRPLELSGDATPAAAKTAPDALAADPSADVTGLDSLCPSTPLDATSSGPRASSPAPSAASRKGLAAQEASDAPAEAPAPRVLLRGTDPAGEEPWRRPHEKDRMPWDWEAAPDPPMAALPPLPLREGIPDAAGRLSRAGGTDHGPRAPLRVPELPPRGSLVRPLPLDLPTLPSRRTLCRASHLAGAPAAARWDVAPVERESGESPVRAELPEGTAAGSSLTESIAFSAASGSAVGGAWGPGGALPMTEARRASAWDLEGGLTPSMSARVGPVRSTALARSRESCLCILAAWTEKPSAMSCERWARAAQTGRASGRRARWLKGKGGPRGAAVGSLAAPAPFFSGLGARDPGEHDCSSVQRQSLECC